MGSSPTDDELRAFIEMMLSNLDRQLREPEVIEEALRTHRDMWEVLYRASADLESSGGEAS